MPSQSGSVVMKFPSDTTGGTGRNAVRTTGCGRRRAVLLVLPTHHPSLVAGIVRYAKEAEWSVDGFAPREDLLPQAWCGDGVLAHLGASESVDRKIVAFLKRLNAPAVTVGTGERTFSPPRIRIDQHAIAQAAATHFLERGYRSFLCVHGSDALPVSRIRAAAFRECVQAAGHVCAGFEWDWTTADSRRKSRLMAVLRNMELPLAVWAVTDHLAVHATECALSIGRRVPEDVAVVGCDNDTAAAAFSQIPLSTIDAFECAGFEAAALLDRMMDGASAPPEQVLVRPRGVISRASTDAIAASARPVAEALEFLRGHWQEPVRATDISRAVGVSVGRLFTAFRREVRKSPMAVLLELRLREAERMLTESGDKLEFIAVTCGFGSKSNFSRVFKKARGVSPQAWRKAALENGLHGRSPVIDSVCMLSRAA